MNETAVRAHLDQLTKPPGSLGRLEDLACRLALIQQTLRPVTRPRRAVLFAGDHGVVASGVTAWPSAVTGLMIANIVGGGAASSVLARTVDCELRLVDVGSVAEPLPAQTGYRCAKVAAGTADLATGPAMDVAAFRAALAIGREEAVAAAEAGCKLLLTGEMGIGNTTPAACLAALLGDWPAASVTGRGAGVDDAGLTTKTTIVEQAVARERPRLATAPEAAMAAVAGFEIVAMAGFYQGAAERGVTVLLDGFIATAAALVAETLRPGTVDYLIAAHRSVEPGHALLLERLGLPPLLDWNLRLGEGTGALLAVGLVDAAAAICGEMATFADLGIG